MRYEYLKLRSYLSTIHTSFQPISRLNDIVPMGAQLINKTSQLRLRTLHNHLLPRILPRLLRPDFFYFVQLALQLWGDLVDLALHPVQSTQPHARVAAQIVECAVNLVMGNEYWRRLQTIDVALLSFTQRAVNENVFLEVG